MRTTLDIDAALLIQAKKLAADTGRSLKAVVEDALRERFLRTQQQAAFERRFEFPTFSSEVMPGVDLNNSASLLDIMEEDDAPF